MIVRVDTRRAVALETTVVAHGLPDPIGIETAVDMESIVRSEGAEPATIGVLKGEVIVGMTREELRRLLDEGSVKVGARELPFVLAKKLNADTTVSATMRISKLAEIRVFVTGGIGGVHQGEYDVSQDLVELSKDRMIVVSAGAKSILDLRTTVEALETLEVIVVGYKTDEFPAFYSASSGIKLNMRVDSVEEIVQIYRWMEKIDFDGALLVANPIPKESEIPYDEVQKWIEDAEMEANRLGIGGKEVTPFLLSKISELSGGRTLKANIELLKNNASLGAKIAIALEENL